ncbi:MAG TPA: glycosyltransferase family 87 protein [Allosphingosinicella sp.]|nr:glycosyltransferase family 87 protein [Allosphingosinicella sp.]
MSAAGGKSRLERLRLPAMAVALCFLFVAVIALVTIVRDPYQMDFISYWAAGRLGIEGQAPLAYDFAAHRAVELQATMVGGIPYGYPPAFLFIAAPFALFPYPPAAVAWVVLTWAAYALAVRLWLPRAYWLAMALPPVLTNAITGQAGFLIAALFVGGMALLPKRPLLGGLLLGLMVVKPQLGLVLPFALAAGREWRGFIGAAAGSLGFLLLGLLVFGLGSYQAWLGNAGLYSSVVADGLAGWHKMASVYASLRLAGLDATPAWIVQGLVALAAIAACARLWHRHGDWGIRAAALAAATALASPYLFGYDTLLLIVPLAWLTARGRHGAALALCWALLLLGLLQVLELVGGPNLAPLAPAILLLLVWREAQRGPESEPFGLSASASEAVPEPRRAGAG